jgi:hypothetical protein
MLETVMPDIIHYIKQPGSFDPETLSVMGAAYDSALKAFPVSALHIREQIASRIVHGARTGERDPDKLCQMALSTLCSEAAQ